MFGNNNSAIVRKLSKRSLKTDKKRNLFIITAIMLTTMLITSTLSIGMSILESLQMQKIRMVGSVTHAIISNPTSEQIDILHNLSYVKHTGTGTGVGLVKNTPKMGQIFINLTYVDDTQWKYMNAPAFVNINGQYPQQFGEIMLSVFALERLGILTPEIGMSIELSFWTGDYRNTDEPISYTFTLSGWFTNYFYARSGGWDYALISQEFAERNGASLETKGSASILFKDEQNVEQHVESLRNDIQLKDSQTIEASPVYSVDYSSFASTFVILIILSLFFVFTGMLLIYNVLYISISRDIRFYGLLKTVGTTPKQIGRIVIRIVLRLCIIGIPLGFVLSALISYTVIPLVISASTIATGTVISFSPFIYLGAMLFALLTAFIGTILPAKKAAQITPIQAIKYTEGKPSRDHANSAKGKLHRMAIRNIFRDRKRALVVLLSITLSVSVFIIVTAVASSINSDKMADMMMKNDFRLENKAMFSTPITPTISDELLESLKYVPGFKQMQTLLETVCSIDYLPEEKEFYIEDMENNNTLKRKSDFDYFYGTVFGIDKSVIDEMNKKLKKPIDADGFERGEFALMAADNPSIYTDIEQVKGTFLTGTTVVDVSFTIHLGGFVPSGYIGDLFQYNARRTAPSIYISNSYLRQIADWPKIACITIDVEKNKEKEAFFIVNEILKNNGDISMSSKYQIRQDIDETIAVFYILGGGISLVLGLIGIMNFINIMSVGIIIRKRELAVLESIGMEKKKLRIMLVYEGIGYATMSLLLALVIGSGIAAGICTLLSRNFEYFLFSYPFIPVIAICIIIMIISVITPEVIYRSVNKTTIVERLRQSE